MDVSWFELDADDGVLLLEVVGWSERFPLMYSRAIFEIPDFSPTWKVLV